MGTFEQWLHEHHLLPETGERAERYGFVEVVKNTWVIVVLLLLGLMALVTAVLIAWPALSYIGSRWFG